MKNLAKLMVGIGVISLIISAAAKLVNAPILSSKPMAIMTFSETCFLLAIALVLLEEKK